jgi:hypothetical protein
MLVALYVPCLREVNITECNAQSLFPHGIDVLRKADFFAVGIRRNAFLAVAPEVAEYGRLFGLSALVA